MSKPPARPRRPWRSIVFAPIGDGQTRRRGSDAFRVGFASFVVLVCWLANRAGSHQEHVIATTMASPPNGIRWLITLIWWVGSIGIIGLTAALALASRRWSAVRDVGMAGALSLALCLVLVVLWGSTGGRPPDASLQHFDLHFPVIVVAVTVAMAVAALPYLSRWLQRSIAAGIGLLALAAVVNGSGLPVGVLASLAIGWGAVAIVHLIVGSPLGLPSADELVVLLEDLGIQVDHVVPHPDQEWGVGRFSGDIDGKAAQVSVYGRDDSEAQLLAKTVRFLFYRDSGPTLSLTRRQQVEHEAYLTLMAERAGARVPAVLAAGPAGPAHDALLVTQPPDGKRLSTFAPFVPPPDDTGSDVAGSDVAGSDHTGPPLGPEISDAAVDDVFRQLVALREAGIAHGSLSTHTIVADDAGHAGFVDFRYASTVATAAQLDRDTAAALAAVAEVAGPDRAVESVHRLVTPDALVAALPFLQRAALGSAASRSLRGKKSSLSALRERGAAVADVDVPKLVEPRRISWVSLVLVLGTLVGGWALIGVLVNVTKSWGTIKGADWAWVVVVFFLSQAAYPAIAVTTIGSVTNPLPYGRTLALEVADTFVALAGGSMAVLATRVRFFQQEGYSGTVAVSSGVLVSTASWIVKGALFLIALPIAISNFNFKEPSNSSGSHAQLVWLIVIAVVVVGVAAGLVFAVPRWRRLATEKLRPKASEVWAHLRLLAEHPRNLVEIFGGNIVAQLVVALALGASLHAFGDHLGLASLVVVLTLGSMLGGVSPVPGGMGVVEAGMIIGLTAAGINQTDAVAAVFVQRLFTAYLPPIWGWFVLVWMRKKEYL